MITWKRHSIYFSWVWRLCIDILGKQNKNFLSLWRKLQIRVGDHKKDLLYVVNVFTAEGLKLWENLLNQNLWQLMCPRANIGYLLPVTQLGTILVRIWLAILRYFFSPTCLIALLECKIREDRSLPYETDYIGNKLKSYVILVQLEFCFTRCLTLDKSFNFS